MSSGRRRNAARLLAAVCERILARSSFIFWIACPSAVAFSQNITSELTANGGMNNISLTGGSYTVTTTSGSPITYSGIMSGTGTVEATGNGTLILDNTNTYTLPSVTETISSIQISGSNKQFASYEGYTTEFSPALSNGDDGGFNGPIYTLHYGSSGQPDAPAATIDAGVALQFGTNTDLHEGEDEVGAGNISDATSSNMNLDNIEDNGTFTFQGNNTSFSDTQYVGQISGTGAVVVQTGIMALYNANSFSGPLLIENNMTGYLGSDHITASIPNASAVFDNGTLILDTPYNTPAAQPMTITQNIYENHFGNDVNVNGFGGLVVLAGVYTYTDNSNNTNDPAGQMAPSLSNPDDNYNNELNVIDNRRGINIGISSGTGSTNPSGGIVQMGNGTSTNFFLPGNPLTTYISLEQNSILALDYSNSGPTYVNTIIAGGPTGTSDVQESLATPGTGTVIFHQGDIVVTQQQYYDGVTQIDSEATLQMGDGTNGDTQLSGGKISFQTSGGDGNLLQSGQTVSVTDTTGESGHSSTSTGTSANRIVDNGEIVMDDVNASLLSNLSGTGSLIQAGAGTTTLGANISYSGATSIIGGTLALGSGASLGASSGVSMNTLTGSERSAIVAGANALFANPAYVSVGSPTLDISQAGSQTIAALNGDSTGTIDLGGNALTINTSSSTVFNGEIVDGGIGGGEGGSLVKAGSGTLTLGGDNKYTGGTTVGAGRLLIEPTGATTSALANGALSISGSGVVQLASNVTAGSQSANVPTTPPASNVNITSLSITGSGALDIGNNHIIVNYGGGADPIASIAGWITSGYDGGTWKGSGIMSSSAQANPGSYGIGYADAADAGNPAGLASGQIEIMYTLLGDANLDGKVNGGDFTILAANFNQGGKTWDEGDFNYDGSVNGGDFTLLAGNFNQSATQSAVSAADLTALEDFAAADGISLGNVPEPVSAATMAIAGLGFLARRRRPSGRGFSRGC